MIPSMVRILEIIRRAVRDSDKSQYRIAQDTGLSKSQLSRLMSGERGLSIETIERLAKYLNLEIIVRPKQRRKRG